MNDIKIGQVLSLIIRFNNSGLTATSRHPYLVVDVNNELKYIEIAQLDSLFGKEHKAARRTNKVIYCSDPVETVIDKDSYIQLDNCIRIEQYDELAKFRRQPDTLSEKKLRIVLDAYNYYHTKFRIDEDKIVFMDYEEITRLNP